VGWALIDARLWLRDAADQPARGRVPAGRLLPLVTWAAVQFLLRYAGWRQRGSTGLPAAVRAADAADLLAAGPEPAAPAAAPGHGVALRGAGRGAFYLHRVAPRGRSG
jgi:two-component system sensor histidine kinase UhpB